MSNVFKKLLGGGFENTFKLFFVSEGYLANDEMKFYSDVIKIWKDLLKLYPLSMVKYKRNPFSLYSCFKASSNSGYTQDQISAIGFNNFSTYYSNNRLFYDTIIVDDFLNDSIYFNATQSININEYLHKSYYSNSFINSLVIILLPHSANLNAECEIYTDENYHSVATTMDGYAEQIVLRGIAKSIGLGDEFDLAGIDYEAPTFEQACLLESMYPNLTYYPDNVFPNPSIDDDFKWRQTFPSSFNQSLIPNLHIGNVAIPDRNLAIIETSFDQIELWEGGGGYRTKVFRSAQDCLQRRRIGDTTLPVKSKKVGLCPICLKIFENLAK
jgi:hypothetical protein